MSARKLGRGLDTLIHRSARQRPAEEDAPGTRDDPEFAGPSSPPLNVVEIAPRALAPNPQQPRKAFDEEELRLLKASISQTGLLQPVLVRKLGDGYQLIAGERRLRAAQELDLPTIPAIVTELADDRLLELALVENIQREDLNSIEVGRAYQQLMRINNWTQDDLARNLGVSRSGVANTLRLLDLPADMQAAVVRRHITVGHAKVLLSVEDPSERQQLFDRIAEERLSVRELEGARLGAPTAPAEPASKPSSPPPKRSARIVSLEEELSRGLGTKVRIVEAKRGKRTTGRISIEFYSADDFERLRRLLLAGSPTER